MERKPLHRDEILCNHDRAGCIPLEATASGKLVSVAFAARQLCEPEGAIPQTGRAVGTSPGRRIDVA